MDAAAHLSRAIKFPYDRGEDTEPLKPPTDWAELAARAVLDNLQGRRGVGGELQVVDDETCAEIVQELAEIIRAAPAYPLAPPPGDSPSTSGAVA